MFWIYKKIYFLISQWGKKIIILYYLALKVHVHYPSKVWGKYILILKGNW